MAPSRSVINGLRPSPLRVNKNNSQAIKKQAVPNEQSQAKHGHSPVIIYAHSPKIIHTKPRDFMALVQRLTGLSRSEENSEESIDLNEIKPLGSEDKDEVSSPSKNGGEVNDTLHLFSPPFPNQFLADIPLFTPSSNNLFFSPRNIYGYGDNVSWLPKMASPTRPSIVGHEKEIQQY